MSDQQEALRERREALAQAVNSHDQDAVLSFIHPTFVGKTKRGSRCADYQHVVHRLQQRCAPGSDYQETVAIEDIEVNGNSAKLVTRRTERGRLYDSEASSVLSFLGLLFLANFGIFFIELVSLGEWHSSDWGDTVRWGVVSAACLGLAFLMRRPVHRTVSYQETWRTIEGRWLLVEEQGQCALMPTRHRLVAVAVVAAAVGAYVAWDIFTGPAWHGTEFQRSGVPAIKLEARRGSTEKVEGWKRTATLDAVNKERIYYVSPQMELSNEDVLSTGVYFSEIWKRLSRWRVGATTLVFAVAIFLVWWWSDRKWWWGVSGGVVFLLGLYSLWHGLTSTDPRFEQRGTWTVVMRCNDAGTKKIANVPARELVFLVDGELFFAAPQREKTEGVYYLSQGFSFDPNRLTKEDATRIAKGIVGP